MKTLREHQLLVALSVLAVFILSLGTWATWHEFATNEGLGMEGKAEFWSSEFLAYWTMQLMMNLVPEILGFIIIVLFAAEFRERFSTDR